MGSTICGLTGAIGPNINVGTLRALMVLNQQRGDDATGFFNTLPRDNWIKDNVKSEVFLRSETVRKWLDASAKNCWAICGHTRGGTRGGNMPKNAHPFEYGTVVGAHNGVLDCPAKYSVDSEYAIDLLSQSQPGEYQKALADVVGWYVLTWFDQRDQSIYFLNWTGDLWFNLIDGTCYYSSCGWHLSTATGYEKGYNVKHGSVVRFRMKKGGHLQVKNMPDFKGKRRDEVHKQAWVNHSHYSADGENWVGSSRNSNYSHFSPPKGKTYWDLTGWVRKFKNGLWHAEQYNSRYQIITSEGQEWLNKRFGNASNLATYGLGHELNKLTSYVQRNMSFSKSEAEKDTDLEKATDQVVTPSQLKTEAEQEAEQREDVWREIGVANELAKMAALRRQALTNEGKDDNQIERILAGEGLLDPILVGM